MARTQLDVTPLFSARTVRLFAYGALSVVLALYLHETGMSGSSAGLLFTLTLQAALWLFIVSPPSGIVYRLP